MPAQRKLNDIEERKHLLLLQADLHRTLIRAECAYARSQISGLNDARNKMRSAGPWVALGAAAIALLTVTRGRNLARWIPTVFATWRWLRTMRPR
jgi:hypothetical protein